MYCYKCQICVSYFFSSFWSLFPGLFSTISSSGTLVTNEGFKANIEGTYLVQQNHQSNRFSIENSPQIAVSQQQKPVHRYHSNNNDHQKYRMVNYHFISKFLQKRSIFFNQKKLWEFLDHSLLQFSTAYPHCNIHRHQQQLK